MKQIISALIVDKNYKKHDYKDIYLKNTPRYIEEKFDIKVLENCDNILYELDKNRGVDWLITIGDVDITPLMGVTYEIRKKWIHLEKYDSIEISNAIL